MCGSWSVFVVISTQIDFKAVFLTDFSQSATVEYMVLFCVLLPADAFQSAQEAFAFYGIHDRSWVVFSFFLPGWFREH
jgi:hypothetical protein